MTTNRSIYTPEEAGSGQQGICAKCGVAPSNVDDCGEFGNPECPYFGIGREEYEKRFGEDNNLTTGEQP